MSLQPPRVCPGMYEGFSKFLKFWGASNFCSPQGSVQACTRDFRSFQNSGGPQPSAAPKGLSRHVRRIFEVFKTNLLFCFKPPSIIKERCVFVFVCVCVCVHGTTYSVSQSTAEHSTIVHRGPPANDVDSKQHQGSHQQDTTPTHGHNDVGLYLVTWSWHMNNHFHLLRSTHKIQRDPALGIAMLASQQVLV